MTNTIIEQFERQVEKTPDSIAIVEFSPATQAIQYFTFKQVNERANSYARQCLLGANQSLSNTNIVLFAEPNANYRIAVLAILKLNATIVPIDPSYPSNKTKIIMEEVTPSLIIDNRILEMLQHNFENVDKSNLSFGGNLDQSTLILFTSGTTGKPKGVVFSAKNLIKKLEATENAINYIPTDTISICITKPIFDVAWYELLSPLLTGGTQAVAKTSIAHDPHELANFIEKVKHLKSIAILQGTPTHLMMLCKSLKRSHSGALKNIILLLVGETLRPNLVTLLQDCGVGETYNFYGPTEGLIWNTVKKVFGRGIVSDLKNITIGYPLESNFIRILDGNRQEVPSGVQGQIFIGGILADGYYKQEELTDKKFIFIDGERLYESGDLGKINSSGEIEYCGRNDTQVKIMGVRVELEEIEAILSQHPRVQTAVAVVIGNREGFLRLAVYIEPKPLECNISIFSTKDKERFDVWKKECDKGSILFARKTSWKALLNIGEKNFIEINIPSDSPFLRYLPTSKEDCLDMPIELRTALATYPLFVDHALHLTEEDLREYCSQTLLQYAIPSYLYLTPKIKTTANMKVDRVSLTSQAERRINQYRVLSPRTKESDLQTDFKGVLLSLLRRSEIRPDYENCTLQTLGIDSITLNELTAIIANRYGSNLPRNFLFKNIQIKSILEYINKTQIKEEENLEILPISDEDNPEVVEVFRVPSYPGYEILQSAMSQSENFYPLTFAQTRLLILSGPGDNESGAAFNLYKAFKITGEFSLEAFRLALYSLLINQKILRTLYQTLENIIVQRVVSESQLLSYLQIGPFQKLTSKELQENKQTICTIDMTGAKKDKIEEAMQVKLKQNFDLSTDLSWRAVVIKIKERFTVAVKFQLTLETQKKWLSDHDAGDILFVQDRGKQWKAFLIINEQQDFEEISISSLSPVMKILENIKNENVGAFDVELLKKKLRKKWIFKTPLTVKDEHYVAFCFHHISVDPYSLNIFLRSVTQLYATHKESFDKKQATVSDQITPPKLQISDIANFEFANRNFILSKNRLQYWETHLKGIQPLLIPTEFRRKPTDISHPGEEMNFSIPSKIVEQIIEHSSNNNVTLFTFFASITYLLFYHLSGQRDLTLATALATREDPKKIDTIGFQIEVVPLRQQIDPDAYFQDFLSQVSSTVNAARKHYIPLQELVKLLNINSSNRFAHKQMPGLNVGIIYVDCTNDSTLELPGAKVEEQFYTLPILAKLDVTIFMYRQCSGELKCVVEFSKLLFTKSSIKNAIIKPLQKLFFETANDPKKLVKNYNAISQDFLQLVLSQNCDNLVEEEKSIGQYFLEYAEKYPNEEKLECEGTILTNREVANYSKKLARYLIEKIQLLPGEFVALVFRENIHRYVATLAATIIGCPYLPIDPSDLQYQSRVSKRLKNIKYIITESSFYETIQSNYGDNNKTVISLDDDFLNKLPQHFSSGSFEFNFPKNLPLCAFATSGTTGEPKIVVLKSHTGIINLVEYLKSPAVYNLPDDESAELRKFLLIYSYSSDGYSYGMWLGLLCNQSKIYLTNDFGTEHGIEGIINPQLISLITAKKITHIPVMPTNAAHIVSTLTSAEELSSLQYAGIAGDNLSPELVNKFPSTCEVFNLFGPTETFICAATYRHPPERNIDSVVRIPIGTPVPNFKFYVFEECENIPPEQWKLALPYSYGRLFIACPYDMEYAGEKELTAAAFIQHEDFGKLYDTKDLVQVIIQNNQIMFVHIGRKNNFIRINSCRIDLKEIEQCIYLHPDILHTQASFDSQTGTINVAVTPKPHVNEDESLQKMIRTLYMKTYDLLFAQTEQDKGIVADVKYLGWDNELTRKPLPINELIAINEYDARQIIRYNPSTLINVGCGMSGILMNLIGLGASFKSICLYDYSQAVITALQNDLKITKTRKTSAFAKKVDVRSAEASESFEGSDLVDIILLISVIQYFSNYGYLTEVITRALPRIQENGGVIYIADIRDLRLLNIFRHEKFLLSNEYAHLSVKHWSLLAEHAIENQLFVDMKYFLGFASLCENDSGEPACFLGVKIELRHRHFGNATNVDFNYNVSSTKNDLLPFRLSVTLQKFTQKPAQLQIPWKIWDDSMSLNKLMLEIGNNKGNGAVIAYKGIPNNRLSGMCAVFNAKDNCATVTELKEIYDNASINNYGIEPDLLIAIAEQYEFDYHLMPSLQEPCDPFTFDAIFYPQKHNNPTFFHNIQYPEIVPDIVGKEELGAFANNPTKGLAQQQLLYRLWENIERELPTTSRPKSIIVTDRTDLSANDFPKEMQTSRNYDYLAPPRNELDRVLIAIWKKVLNIISVSIYDNFFECSGGTSITAAHVMFLIREQLHLNLSVYDLFNHPTIIQLSNYIQIEGNSLRNQSQHKQLPAIESQPSLRSPRSPPKICAPSTSPPSQQDEVLKKVISFRRPSL